MIISARFASVAIAAVIFIAAPVFAQTSSFWTYEQLARTPNAYVGSTLTFTGKVVQATQDERGGTVLRIAISPDGHSSIIYVEYGASPSEPRILEDDIVDVRAKFIGIKSYKAVIGNIIQIPHVIACEVRSIPKTTIQVVRVPLQPTPCDISPSDVAQPGSVGSLANPGALNEKAPHVYKARFQTSKGVFVVEVHRDWAPNGADRFYNLVKNGFYDETRFFRVVSGFMVQFGINGNPTIQAPWRTATIMDDPVRQQSNKRSYITFGTAGPNTRTTQVFINFADNSGLDRQGFSPFGQVISGMNVVDSLFNGYGEGAPSGRGPEQGRIQREGNAYLKTNFPNLDYVKQAIIEK
jgi:peptidyl-prolyl cis-trans isomerase A (cyclophilin A)